MPLTGSQLRQLHQALLSAFPSRGNLAQMVRYELNENLDAIAGGSSLSDTTFQLLQWASAHGRVEELISRAVATVPGNPALREVTASLGIHTTPALITNPSAEPRISTPAPPAKRELAPASKSEPLDVEVEVKLRMAEVPTSIYSLLKREETPLVTCRVRNPDTAATRRLRITSYIEGYSAHAVEMVRLAPRADHAFDQLPTLFPDTLEDIHAPTLATLHVTLEDRDGGGELDDRTERVWLLPKTTVPLDVKDPTTGEWKDLTPYLGAFVTPNAPSVLQFLSAVADEHPERRLVGYQGNESVVEAQTRAVFDALKAAGILYVSTSLAFSPEQGSPKQRVRLPRESLANKQANCIDGMVLFASLLEAMSLNPALVFIPGHAFVGWETWPKTNEWRYLETTMIANHSFEDARTESQQMAAAFESEAISAGNPRLFRRWALRVLREERRIMPME